MPMLKEALNPIDAAARIAAATQAELIADQIFDILVCHVMVLLSMSERGWPAEYERRNQFCQALIVEIDGPLSAGCGRIMAGSCCPRG